MEKIKRLIQAHPRLAAWLALAVAMLGIFLVAARHVVLEPAQRLVIAAAIVLLAGLCVWIVYWDEAD